MDTFDGLSAVPMMALTEGSAAVPRTVTSVPQAPRATSEIVFPEELVNRKQVDVLLMEPPTTIFPVGMRFGLAS